MLQAQVTANHGSGFPIRAKLLRRDIDREQNIDISPFVVITSGIGAIEESVMDLLHAHFRPECLNRLDEIILFTPLTKENIAGIIDLIIADLNKRLADRQITIKLTDAAKEFVADAAYDPSYGARPIKRYIQKHVETLSAKLILQDKADEGDTIVIDVADGALTAYIG